MLKPIFIASYLDQQKTVKSLLQESRSDTNFYVLLGLASFIACIGLLMNSTVVIIGGMLIGPILFPILSLALAVVTASRMAINRALFLLIKASIFVVILSFLVSFLLAPVDFMYGSEILLRVGPNLLFFLSSFAAGLAVAYAWVKQDLSATLPGVAVSVTLVPPLVTVGIGLKLLDFAVVGGALAVFLLDVLATILGAMVIFTLFGFAQMQNEEEDIIKEEKQEDQVQKKALEEEMIKDNNI